MSRVTINKVNERINRYGFELVRGEGYYYFSRLSNSSPTLHEEGIYGTPNISAWTIDQLEEMLAFRIMDDAPAESSNLYVCRAGEFLQTILDKSESV